MKSVWATSRLRLAAVAIGITTCVTDRPAGQTAERGATPGVVLTNISKNSDKFASVFPQVAVSPADDRVVGVAWRQYSLPIDTNAPKGQRTADCHVAISTDAGSTFRDANLMTYLRRERLSAAEPELWYCNAPWVAFGPDGAIYAGGSVYTANGVTGAEPKQGRARLTVSTNGGVTWSPGTHGITPTTFAPGTNAPPAPENTPWDGANGMVDPNTGALFTTAGGSFAISLDHAKTFGLVYQPTLPAGWERQGNGTMSVSHGVLIAPFFAPRSPVGGAKCPCLAVAASVDYGRTPFAVHLAAEADAISTQGTVRYPVSAADRGRAGRFAVVTYTADHRRVAAHYTEDGGLSWKLASPSLPDPLSTPAATVNQAGIGYTTDGRILVVWRAFDKGGTFDTFAALLDVGTFGPTIRVSGEPSTYPAIIGQGNYGQNNGGGDFTTWITGNRELAFVAFPYAPKGLVEDTYFARIPLAIMAPRHR
jgi:hypothetical protein